LIFAPGLFVIFIIPFSFYNYCIIRRYKCTAIYTKEHRKFCSAECKKKAKYPQKEEKPKPFKKISISEIARIAREKGLSYGKYVEALEKGLA
jgi:ribosomal protein L20